MCVCRVTSGLWGVSTRTKCVWYLSTALDDCATVTQGFLVCPWRVHTVWQEPQHEGAYMCVVPVLRCIFCVWHIRGPVWCAELGNGRSEAFV